MLFLWLALHLARWVEGAARASQPAAWISEFGSSYAFGRGILHALIVQSFIQTSEGWKTAGQLCFPDIEVEWIWFHAPADIIWCCAFFGNRVALFFWFAQTLIQDLTCFYCHRISLLAERIVGLNSHPVGVLFLLCSYFVLFIFILLYFYLIKIKN